jgi:hypothetical protein
MEPAESTERKMVKKDHQEGEGGHGKTEGKGKGEIQKIFEDVEEVGPSHEGDTVGHVKKTHGSIDESEAERTQRVDASGNKAVGYQLDEHHRPDPQRARVPSRTISGLSSLCGMVCSFMTAGYTI